MIGQSIAAAQAGARQRRGPSDRRALLGRHRPHRFDSSHRIDRINHRSTRLINQINDRSNHVIRSMIDDRCRHVHRDRQVHGADGLQCGGRHQGDAEEAARAALPLRPDRRSIIGSSINRSNRSTDQSIKHQSIKSINRIDCRFSTSSSTRP